MAFENGLQANIPLQGLASTNPVPNFTASVMDQNANTQANTANTQAQTQTELQKPALVQAQTAAQQANANLVGWQAKTAQLDYGQAQAMIQAGKDTVSQVFGPNASTPTPSVASPTPNVVTTQDANGQTVQQPAPVVSQQPSTKVVPTQAPANGQIAPPAAPTKQQAEQHIANNNTTPNGMPNILSDDFLESYKNNMLKNGVRLDTVNTTMASLYKTRAELAKNAAETQSSLETARATAQKNDANFAYQLLDLNKVDPSVAHTLAMQHYGIDTSTPGGIALLKSMANGSEQYGKSQDVVKTQAETGLAAANTVKAAQETATSATQQRKTQQEIDQAAGTYAVEKTKQAGAAASGQAIVQPALTAIDKVAGNDTLIKNGLNTWSRQALGSEAPEVKTDSLLELPSAVAAPVHAELQKLVGSAAQPGTDAYNLKQQVAPIQAALSYATTVAEKQEGATTPKNQAYLEQMHALVGQIDPTKQTDPEQFKAALAQAKAILKTFQNAQGNVLDTLNAKNPFGAQQAPVKPTESTPKITTLSEAKKAAQASGMSTDAYVARLMKDGWKVQ